MYDGHRRGSITLSVVVSLALGLVAGCSVADGSGPVEVDSADTNYTTVTGSLSVGDPVAGPAAPTEVLPPAVAELPSNLEGAPSASGSPVAVTDIVFEGDATVRFGLAGNGAVSYTVRYVDQAVRYGTGEPLAVPGRSVLQVDLLGTSTEPDPTFTAYAGPERVRPTAGSAVVSVDFLADPGGVSQSFVGVAADRPEFTVTTTEQPAAVIVTVES